MANSIPAKAKATGRHRLSVDFSHSDALKLEALRRVTGDRGWGDTVRRLVRRAYGKVVRGR